MIATSPTSDLACLVAAPGPNDVPWIDPALPAQPLTLRSARPRQFSAATPVLFVHHGVLRNGGDYRDFWLPLVDEADLLVVVPEFSNEAFPGPRSYNFGNREDAQGAAHPRERCCQNVAAYTSRHIAGGRCTYRRSTLAGTTRIST